MPNKNSEQSNDGLLFDQDVLNDLDLMDNDIDSKLNDWLTTNDISLSEIQCTLYKYDNADSGSGKAQIGVWKNDIPDRHTVGLKHGAGKYTILIIKPKSNTGDRKITSRTFKLHEHYNTLQLEEQNKNNPYANMPGMNPMMFPVQQPQHDNMDMIKVMQQMMANTMQMLTPILAAAIAPKGNGNGNPLDQYSMVDKLLQNNAKNNIEFYGELQKKMIDKDIELGSEENPTLIQQILPLIDKFLPMFTSSKTTPDAENTLKAIKESDQYKEVIKDKSVVKQLISHLEDKHGKVKVSKVLKKLNITRPKG